MDSRCYRKFDSQLTWYDASNECLSRGGSLAVFSRIGRPSDNSQLTSWLNASGTDKSYWIGFVRSFWKITDEGNFNHFHRTLDHDLRPCTQKVICISAVFAVVRCLSVCLSVCYVGVLYQHC